MAEAKTFTGPGWFLDYTNATYMQASGVTNYSIPTLFHLSEGQSFTQTRVTGSPDSYYSNIDPTSTSGGKFIPEIYLQFSGDYNSAIASEEFAWLQELLDDGSISDADPYNIHLPAKGKSNDIRCYNHTSGENLRNVWFTVGTDHYYVIPYAQKDYGSISLKPDPREIKQTTGLILSTDQGGDKAVNQSITYANPNASEAVHAEFARKLNAFSKNALKDTIRVDRINLKALADPCMTFNGLKFGYYDDKDDVEFKNAGFKLQAQSMSLNKPTYSITDADGNTPDWITAMVSTFGLNGNEWQTTDKSKWNALPETMYGSKVNLKLTWAADNDFGEHSMTFKGVQLPTKESITQLYNTSNVGFAYVDCTYDKVEYEF